MLPTQYKATGKVSNFKENFSYSGGNYYSFDLSDETGKVIEYPCITRCVLLTHGLMRRKE